MLHSRNRFVPSMESLETRETPSGVSSGNDFIIDGFPNDLFVLPVGSLRMREMPSGTNPASSVRLTFSEALNTGVAIQVRIAAPGPGSTPVSGGPATTSTDHAWGSHFIVLGGRI